MRSRPGREATTYDFAAQLGVCWAEMGPHYDSANEPVIQNATALFAFAKPRLLTKSFDHVCLITSA
jgi:hypothetical protein